MITISGFRFLKYWTIYFCALIIICWGAVFLYPSPANILQNFEVKIGIGLRCTYAFLFMYLTGPLGVLLTVIMRKMFKKKIFMTDHDIDELVENQVKEALEDLGNDE